VEGVKMTKIAFLLAFGCLGAFFVFVRGGPRVTQETGTPVEIRAFVHQTFIHGVPYEEASRYDSRAVPVLLGMLNDRKEEVYWTNIAATLGIIGDERAFVPLTEFLSSGEGKLSHSEYIAKSSVPMALGYLVNRSRYEKGLQYLIESLEPAVWEPRAVKWVSPYHEASEDRDVQLSIMAILGLALSGQPSAREALIRLQQPAATETAKRFQARVSDVVSLALRDHEIIAKEGLAAYYRRNPIVKGVPPKTSEQERKVTPPYETEPAGLITGAGKPPEIHFGLREAPPVPKPAMEKPYLPPRPANAKPAPLPKPSLPGPPPIKEPLSPKEM
jgi:hypothetical protein